MLSIKKKTISKKLKNSKANISINVKEINNVKILKINKRDFKYEFFISFNGVEIKVISYYIGFLKKGLNVSLKGYLNETKFEYNEFEFIAKDIKINMKESFGNLFLLKKEHENLYNTINEMNLSLDNVDLLKEKIKNKKDLSMLDDFLNIFNEQTILDQLTLLGLDDLLITQLYFKYKDDSLDILKANPYILVKAFSQDIKLSDLIAKKVGVFNEYDTRRIVGILYEIFRKAKIEGNSYLELSQIDKSIKKFVGKDFDLNIFFNELDFLSEKGDFVKKEEKYFLREIYNIEYDIAKGLKSKIKKIKLKEDLNYNKIINSNIEKFEKKNGFKLHPQQVESIQKAIFEQTYIITGGPGTGKTTIQGVIFNILKEIYGEEEILVLAPTGIAAKNISKKIESNASTIHTGLGYNPYKFGNEFKYKEDNKLGYKVIIIDEMSMVSSFLFMHLLKATKRTTQIIMVGDSDQLFSIEYGQVLYDMIHSEVVPYTGLNEGFRFNGSVLVNAYKIQRGETDLVYDNDFIFSDVDGDETEKEFYNSLRLKKEGGTISNEKIQNSKYKLDKILEVGYKDKIKKIYGHYLKNEKIPNIKLLSPFNTGFYGVRENNKYISSIIPNMKESHIKYNKSFKEGDVIVNTLNDTELGIMNGDNGIIESIYEDGEGRSRKMVFDINFSGEIISVKGAKLKNIEHSYSLTIHKSQGSGFNVIIIPIFDNNKSFFEKRLLYTAITRSQSKVVLVGKKHMLDFIIKNNNKRNSYLNEILIKLIK